MTAGSFHTCALREDGRIACWGQVSVPNGSYLALSAGGSHTCALGGDGRLECWGNDTYGQVSGPNGSEESYAAVSSGALHTCALNENGRLACWGYDLYGQVSGPNASTIAYGLGLCDDANPCTDDVCDATQGCQHLRDPSCDRPPDCTAVRPSLAELWPPDHKMVAVTIAGVADPDGDPVSVVVTGIAQDEPVGGSGRTCPDGDGIGSDTALLRAERDGSGDGRVHTLSFTAEDDHGGQCAGTVTTCVPHDQGKHGCVDQGPREDSAAPCGVPGPRRSRP